MERRLAVLARSKRLLAMLCVSTSIATGGTLAAGPPPITRFLEAASADDRAAQAALSELAAAWKDSYAAMIIDLARQMRPPRRAVEESPEPAPSFDDERAPTSPGQRSIDVPSRTEPGSRARGCSRFSDGRPSSRSVTI